MQNDGAWHGELWNLGWSPLHASNYDIYDSHDTVYVLIYVLILKYFFKENVQYLYVNKLTFQVD